MHWRSNTAYFLFGAVVGGTLDRWSWGAYADWRFYTITFAAAVVGVVVRWEARS